ncbi:class I SAM-dependent methyltransferase [Candidatus Woesearchaeota archaeon]|nr:class I SAM-dependent methyltransferase [Candidatus Woesearchaeota archaeon]
MEDSCLESPEILKHSIQKKIKGGIIKGFIEPKKEDIILDVGSGGGILDNELSRFVDKIIAFDLSYNNIVQSKKTANRNNIYHLTADATNLPFKNNSFTKIIAADILEHIPKDDMTIKEIDRVLKKNGVLVITTPCTNPTLSVDWLRRKAGLHMEHAFGHVRPGYSKEDIEKLLKGTNLKIEKESYYLIFFGELLRVLTNYVRKLRHGRKEWTDGSDFIGMENSKLFKLYKLLNPIFYVFTSLDNLLVGFKGHQIALKVRKI